MFRGWLFAGLLVLGGQAAYAGNYTNDFATSLGEATPGGSAGLDGGQLRLTPDAQATFGNLLLPDLDPGSAIQSFTLSFNLTIDAKGRGDGADGFSVNFGDPASYPSQSTYYNYEDGAGSGLKFRFITYVVNQVVIDGIVGTPFTNLVMTDGTKQPVTISYDKDTGISLTYRGQTLTATAAQVNAIGFTPQAGFRFFFGARCGGGFEDHLIDDVVINTTLVPNSAPVITNQTFAVHANNANTSLVGSVAATDPDAGQSLAYAITAGNTGGAFAINPTNGQITVVNASALNAITTPSFALTVQVTDNGFPSRSSSATVAINVSPALVETIYGVAFASEGLTLVRFNSDTPGTVTTIGRMRYTDSLGQVRDLWEVRGLDFRPSDGKLYALGRSTAAPDPDSPGGEDWRFYTVNTVTGALTAASTFFYGEWDDYNHIGPEQMQWNPVTDSPIVNAIEGSCNTRIYNFTNVSLFDYDRFNPDLFQNPALFADGDQFSIGPGLRAEAYVQGIAYSNSVAGALSTTLYGYVAGGGLAPPDTLVTLNLPDRPGTAWLHTVAVGSTEYASVDFKARIDISGATGTMYAYHRIYDPVDPIITGQGLFTRDLVSGQETLLGSLPMTLHQIAVAPARTVIETWRQTHFGSTANSGNGADLFDFDQDGLVNLVEFAFGLDPTLASSAQLPQAQLSGGNIFYSFTQPVGVSGVTYGAEWSTTLEAGSWTPIPDTGTPPQRLFSVPLGSNPKQFLRFRITSP